jgi:antitoxin (DNA-binding transcriptional repressor) of toxin-antitoxin stability system
MEKTISKARLKARMLEIFRQLEATGGELIVTDHGKPVLKIIPLKEKMTVDVVFRSLQGQVIYLEEINASTQEEWEEI